MVQPWTEPVAFFLTYETEFVLFLAVLENSVLPMGWLRQLTCDVKSDVRIQNFISDVTFAPKLKRLNDFGKGCYTT